MQSLWINITAGIYLGIFRIDFITECDIRDSSREKGI